MTKAIRLLRLCCAQQKAQGLVEYALIVTFVVGVFLLVTVTNPQLKQAILGAFTRAANTVQSATPGV